MPRKDVPRRETPRRGRSLLYALVGLALLVYLFQESGPPWLPGDARERKQPSDDIYCHDCSKYVPARIEDGQKKCSNNAGHLVEET